jgi:hypothetical protein
MAYYSRVHPLYPRKKQFDVPRWPGVTLTILGDFFFGKSSTWLCVQIEPNVWTIYRTHNWEHGSHLIAAMIQA